MLFRRKVFEVSIEYYIEEYILLPFDKAHTLLHYICVIREGQVKPTVTKLYV